MRYLRAYKWNDILEEEVPRTMISLELIKRENEDKKKQYDKMNKKIPKRGR